MLETLLGTFLEVLFWDHLQTVCHVVIHRTFDDVLYIKQNLVTVTPSARDLEEKKLKNTCYANMSKEHIPVVLILSIKQIGFF